MKPINMEWPIGIDWDSQMFANGQCQENDEVCGKHSGIPKCCRDFYIKAWKPLMESTNFDFAGDIEPDDVSWLVDYIRCPGCRQTGAYVHIKRCPNVQG